jgi:DNA repair protein RecO (recombination protein O)
VPAFLLKVLAAEGSSPVLDGCAGCGDEGSLVAFDQTHGGALCRPCAGMARAPAISAEALALVRRALSGDLVSVLNEPSGATALEVDRLATRAFEGHVERRLRTPTMLDRA